jgi:RNA polymerase sigma-70 factor (ECF subfamily)
MAGLADDEIVRRVRAGEPALFELLMRRYNQRVYRSVRALLRDEHEAEDALQQAWLSAYAHLEQFTGAAAFSTWLTQIALNEGLARLRKSARLKLVTEENQEELAVTSNPENPERAAGSRELARMIEAAVDELPPLYRTVFMLREIEGMSTGDAAACLGVSTDVVKMRLHRAKQALRDKLFEQAGEASGGAFPFMGARCDRVVQSVLAVILKDV